MGQTIKVVGAVLVDGERVLCAQRGPNGSLAGMWEFPGGKIEEGESPAEALEREIREELDCGVQVNDRITTTTHEYDFGVVELTTYYCTLIEGGPQASEHQRLEWLGVGELGDLDWAPADIPAVNLIQQELA